MSEQQTTASILGSYRKELIEQGFDEDQAFELVRDVARDLVENDGLGVSA